MLLFPNCKINIGLDIISRRADGYHNIETVMFPVMGLCDGLEILRTEGNGIVFTSSGLAVDCPAEQNIIARTHRLMQERFGIGGVKVHLHKHIPFGAGLGGGSADSAFTITALNKLFDLGLSITQMEELASSTGSDTPFFIKNTPQICSGRGEIMQPVSINLSGKHLVIIKPSVSVSTAEAYSGVVPVKPETPLAARIALPVSQWKECIANRFEESVFVQYPILASIKEELYDSGAEYAAMSGSGSALFGIFDSKPQNDFTDLGTVFEYKL